MTRSFSTRPVDPALLEHLADLASRAPSAGKTQGWHLVALAGSQTSLFWDIALPRIVGRSSPSRACCGPR